MALFATDWKDELGQVKGIIGDVVDTKLNPMIEGAIAQASEELGSVAAKPATSCRRTSSWYRTKSTTSGVSPRKT